MTPGGEISSCPAASAQQDGGTSFNKELRVFPRKQRSQLLHHPLPPDRRPHTPCTTGPSISGACDEKDWGWEWRLDNHGLPLKSWKKPVPALVCWGPARALHKTHSGHGRLSCPEQGRSNDTHNGSGVSDPLWMVRVSCEGRNAVFWLQERFITDREILRKAENVLLKKSRLDLLRSPTRFLMVLFVVFDVELPELSLYFGG